MSYKTIATIVTDLGKDQAALDAAIALATREEAHLDVLCLGVDRTQPGFYYSGASAVVLQDNLVQAQADAEALETAVDALLGRLVDDDLSARDRERLNAILLEHPEARKIYRQYLDVHGALQEHLAEPDFSALDPVLDAACTQPAPETAILDLKVCDPACGSGHFLVAAARRIADRHGKRCRHGVSHPPAHADQLYSTMASRRRSRR